MALLTLDAMVTDLRAEAGHSLLAAQGTNMEETLKYQLRRTQKELYAAYDWPQLMLDEQLPFSQGDRYLPPTVDIDYEQINTIWSAEGSRWMKMEFGITPAQYSLYPPGAEGFPVRRWRIDPKTQAIEIWPVPSTAGNVLIHGQLMLQSLVDGTDTSTLDGQLIVMFSAAGLLARQKTEDAALVVQKAQRYLNSLLKNQGSQKRSVINRGRTQPHAPRPGLDYIPGA